MVAALDASGVVWSVVYSLETGPPGPILEILVDRPGADRAHRALEELGFAASPRRSPDGAITFFRFDGRRDQWLHLRVREADWATLERAFTSPPGPMRPSIRTGLATVVRAFRHSRHLPGRYSHGLGVALIGPDGAGKSTLAREIEQSFPIAVRSVYMGMNQDSMATIARWQPLGLRVPSLVAALWWRYLVARYHTMRGRIVIFDRYPHEQRSSARPAGSLRERCGRWLLTHACPAPDMAIILDVPGDVMYRRKGEHSPAALEVMRGEFLNLRIPGQQIIDAARPRDEVRVDVVERIWQRYLTEGSNRSHRRGQAADSVACLPPGAGPGRAVSDHE